MMNLKIKSLLVADDDLDDLMFLLDAIRIHSHDLHISHVSDGAELLAFLQEEILPELVILDINIPKIDGIDCLKYIKSHEKFNRVPIVMYSTSSNYEIIEACYQLGASRYIVKPFRYNTIVKFTELILSIDWQENKVVGKETFLISQDNF